MISIAACCHGAKLCAHSARDFRSQQWKCGKSWLSAMSAQTKIGCVKSFAVKCARRWNLLRINATSVENKCNFLTFLLQQKLALAIGYLHLKSCAGPTKRRRILLLPPVEAATRISGHRIENHLFVDWMTCSVSSESTTIWSWRSQTTPCRETSSRWTIRAWRTKKTGPSAGWRWRVSSTSSSRQPVTWCAFVVCLEFTFFSCIEIK